MRAAMRSTIVGFEGFLDLTSMAVLETTVSMALRPAAFMVSPDSVMVSWFEHGVWLGGAWTYQLDLRHHLRLLMRRLLQRYRSIL
jgi:hypothetical protein